MVDYIGNFYPWVKAVHIMAVIAWMAGLFYLPRLFVYHAEQGQSDAGRAAMLQTMEAKLLRVIMTPAMIVTWVCGLLLVAMPGVVDWGQVWPWTKAAGVLAMTGFHHWCGVERKQLAAGTATRSGRFYRAMNEAPTLLMVVIVLSVIVRPF